MSPDPIRVLIVDDSALMRNLIGRIVESDPGLVLVGKAMNGAFALKKLETLSVDIIVLDLEMPEMNGIEFLKKRKELKLETPVIILSSVARRGAEVTMEALSLGAADFIKKPSGSVSEDIHSVGEHLIELIKAYGGGRTSGWTAPLPKTEPRTTPAIPVPAPTYAPAPSKPLTIPTGPLRAHAGLQLCVIGISTGGPNALRQVFSALDPDFPLPIVVVQHMPAGFTAEFAKSLDKNCPLEVKEAEEGDLVKKGRILIAPGDWHVEVEKKSLAALVHLSQAELTNGHRPSAGVLFKSAAKQYGSSVLAVIMTGMGRDGAAEIGEVYKAGGLTIAQDEASSIVFGMPRVAIELGNVEKVVSLGDMASSLNKLAKEFARA